MRISDWSSDVCSSDLVELDERAGIMRLLPRRGFLACAQPHDHVAHPHRLARFERDVAAFAVALVEQPSTATRCAIGVAPASLTAVRGVSIVTISDAASVPCSTRSEERRVGQGGFRPFRSRWSPDTYKK